jgi:hypothetical protein
MHMRKVRAICFVIIGVLVVASWAPVTARPQEDKSGKKDKSDKKKDKEGGLITGSRDKKAILWTEPTNIESLDLFAGPGGTEGAPNPNGRYTFESRAKSGTSEKINVLDAKNHEWQIKFGPEAKPAPAASRIVWAAGYHTDLDYFVKRAHVEGRGGFDVWDVRFKDKDDGYKEDGIWSWHANPFMGKRELDGLKVLMALLNNWDLKDENNKVVHGKKKSGHDTDEQIYYVSDLGATLGKTGSVFRRIPGFGSAPAGSKGDAEAYASQVFILGVKDGKVVFNYKGKDPKALEGVSVENARWMGDLLGRLSDKQLSDAFRAGGFSDSDVQIYTRAFRGRLNQLKNLR